MRLTSHRVFHTIAGAILIAGTLSTPARAEDFYRGKTISLIVASGPSGGYDTYARVLAPYLRRHIPGEPTIVVQNMPAAGGNAGAGHVFNVAPKDGTVLLAGQREVVFGPLLGNKQAVKLLQQTLDEEKETDEKLTELAMSEVNVEAAQTSDE